MASSLVAQRCPVNSRRQVGSKVAVIDRERLAEKAGRLSDRLLTQVEAGLRLVVAL
jgi:mRNA-degrading endonuclease toxin of MazEF toxin-antitoxin module